MADPRLQIDIRCDRIEAALGTLADNLGEGEVVRTILYGGSQKVVDGGGEPRGEGDYISPEEFHIAYNIAKAFHEAYERLAPNYQYSTRAESAVPWELVPEQNKQLMIATVADLLDNKIIKAVTN